MVKRLFDVVAAALALIVVSPLLALAAIGIRWSSPGPVFYRARRTGRGGRPFVMYKLRTMDHAARVGSAITAPQDTRVFPFGAWLRRTKVDELPQLVNVLRGDMSLVGPRPEDPALVRDHYTAAHYQTLAVRPGLASPGSLYQYTHGDELLDGRDAEGTYVQRLLPVKLAIEVLYVRRASLTYDLAIIGRTLGVLAARLAGRRVFRAPPELPEALALLARRHAAIVVLGIGLLFACSADAPARPLPNPTDTGAAMLVGAGDIARCNDGRDDATAALLDHIDGTVFTVGDNAYDNGSATDYAQCYAPSWGRHRARTRPTPGNHEYQTAGAAGYFGYFGAAAGDPAQGYYSYDLGEWHVIALNSEVAIDSTSAQVQWLRGDLASHPNTCTLAYWHRSRFSSGADHGSSPDLGPIWTELYAAGVDVVVSGHDHIYERFAPQTPAAAPDTAFGIRQFVAGTGGDAADALGTVAANSEVRRTGVSGVLAFALSSGRYAWHFVPVAGQTFADSGSGSCHGAPPASVR